MAKHPHKYVKIKLGNDTEVYRCMLPNCSHHMPKYLENTLIGISARCANCENLFIIEEIGADKLICDDCKMNKLKLIEEMADLPLKVNE